MVTGPMATQMLGDLGANVIKVEPPGIGDLVRHASATRGGMSAWFAGINRSKRSIVVNLKEADGSILVKRLAAISDVVIQNFRPGVVERLNLDEAAIRELNNDVIYVSVSAYGETGPYANKGAFDMIIQGLSGMADVQQDTETGDPALVQNAIIDKITSYTVTQGILAALLARERGSGGQHLKVSMIDAAMSLIWADSYTNQAILEDDFVATQDLSKMYRVTKTADGYVAIAAATAPQIAGLLRAVDREDLLDNPKFTTIGEILKNMDEFFAEIDLGDSPPTSAELTERLEAEDVPVGPVYRREEVARDPHIEHMGILQEYDHPLMGKLLQNRPPWLLDKTPASIQRHAPALGENTDEILGNLLELTDDEIGALRARGVVA